jgi:hypothetical protein
MIFTRLFFLLSCTLALGFLCAQAPKNQSSLLHAIDRVKNRKVVEFDSPAVNFFYDNVAAESGMVNASMPDIFKELTSLLQKKITADTAKKIARYMNGIQAWLGTNEGKEYREYNERLLCIFLLKAISVLGKCAVRSIVHTIDLLQDAIIYWKDQQTHQWKYFLHKSPHKWFFGKKQQDEIYHNIRDLESMKDYHDMMLGKVVRYLYTFKPNQSNETCYVWMTEFCTILDALYVVPIKGWSEAQQRTQNVESLLAKCSYHYQEIVHHTYNVQETLSHARKPNHFVRNWLAYSLIGGAALYCYTDPNGLINAAWTSLMGFDIKKNFDEYVKKPLNDLKEATLGNKMPEKSNIGDIPRFTEEVKKWQQNEDEIIGTMVQQVKDAKRPSDIIEKIEKDLRDGNSNSFVEDHLKKEKNAITWKGDFNPVLVKGGYLDVARFEIAHGKVAGARQLDDQIVYFEQRLNDVNDKIYAREREANLPLKIAAIIPATGLIYGLYKLCGWVRSKNYTPLNVVLCDIEDILIAAGDALSDEAYGKMLYKIHIFKKKANKILGVRNTYYYDLTNHIQFLSDDTKTVQQKKELVSAMRKRYPFFTVKT